MCKVSVIIAVYNTGNFLRQCLDSIVGQTLRDIEIICVNDGSTDNSLDILNDYAARDERVKVVSKDNEGLGGASARNLGLSLANGQYVSVLDSDDFFELDMLEKMVKRADETGVDIVVCGGWEYDHRKDKKMKTPSILNENVIPDKPVFSYKDCPDHIYELTKGYAWNKLYRREFLGKHNISFQRIKFTDDAYFTYAHMVLAETISVVNEPLANYRANAGSSQSDGLTNYPDSAYLPYIELKRSLVEWGIYETVKRSFVNCAAAFIRYFYDRVAVYKAFEYLHNKLRNEILEQLDISGNSDDYFYDKRIFQWQKQVNENSAGEYASKAARSHGCENTTAALRFQVPWHLIVRGKRYVIFGAGLIGRHYYSQLLLSDYGDVVLWCDIVNPKPSVHIYEVSDISKVEFDYVLIAYAQKQLIESSVEYLKSIGIPNEKIILGGVD